MRNSFPLAAVLACLVFPAICLVAQDTELADVDANDDGKVTVAEFKEYAETRLQDFEKMDAFVKAVDADSNGEVSEKEFGNRMSVLQKMMRGGAEPKQDEKKDSESNAKASNTGAEAKKAFQKIKKLIAENKWEEAAKHMTKKAQDELVVEQTISAIGLASMEIDFPIPQLEDAMDEIEDVLIKHGIKDLGIDTSSMFKFEMRMGGDDDEDDGADQDIEKEVEAHRPEMKNESEKILNHVNKSGKRWEIVKDLWNAKKASPFSMSPLSGKIEKQEADKDIQLLYVSMAPAEADNNNGIVFQMVAPPAVLRMKKVENNWKFDGRDEIRTAKAMQEFMKKQQEQFGGGGPQREDF